MEWGKNILISVFIRDDFNIINKISICFDFVNEMIDFYRSETVKANGLGSMDVSARFDVEYSFSRVSSD